MTAKQFKTLKNGDIVTPNKGQYKETRCIVIGIISSMSNKGKLVGYIYADYVDKMLSNKKKRGKTADFFSTYKAFKLA